ncbi:MAG TPA: TetR/AcrR family transcriptional regulator [Gaiellaceae bacterium]|nr:TetR/AcrR family transcriptional regulator [Gaiellaceae bacterium]
MTVRPRTQRRSQETRERILDAAIACFGERGFEATTMNAIAERADVARATVFNHFADKQALLTAYLDRRRARVVALVEAADHDSVQTLSEAFTLLAEENERSRTETRELVHAWLRTGGSANAESTERLLADLVAAGQKRGELAADIDPELTGRLLFDVYAGVIVRWTAEPPPFSLRETLLDALSLLLIGLGPRG